MKNIALFILENEQKYKLSDVHKITRYILDNASKNRFFKDFSQNQIRQLKIYLNRAISKFGDDYKQILKYTIDEWYPWGYYCKPQLDEAMGYIKDGFKEFLDKNT